MLQEAEYPSPKSLGRQLQFALSAHVGEFRRHKGRATFVGEPAAQ